MRILNIVVERPAKNGASFNENWQHCKGQGVHDYYGENRNAEVHWFQEETVGKAKFKVKEWKDEG